MSNKTNFKRTLQRSAKQFRRARIDEYGLVTKYEVGRLSFSRRLKAGRPLRIPYAYLNGTRWSNMADGIVRTRDATIR